MDATSQPEQALDQRFFHVTGLVIVLATLMAGAITLTLANQMAEAQFMSVATEAIARDLTVLQKAGGQATPAVLPEQFVFQPALALTPRF